MFVAAVSGPDALWHGVLDSAVRIRPLVTGQTPVAHNPAKAGAFVFRGLAIGDFSIACLAYERARDTGAGQRADW